MRLRPELSQVFTSLKCLFPWYRIYNPVVHPYCYSTLAGPYPPDNFNSECRYAVTLHRIRSNLDVGFLPTPDVLAALTWVDSGEAGTNPSQRSQAKPYADRFMSQWIRMAANPQTWTRTG